MKKSIRLGDISDIASGGTPSRNKPEYWGGDIPWVKTGLIQNCIIHESDIDEWITQKGLKKSSAKLVPRGTILMAMIGQGKTRGQVAILDIEATTNQNAASIQPNKNYDRDYVYQQLLFRYDEIRNISNSSGQQNLNLDLIKTIRIPDAPLREQTAIACLLSTWDIAIEKNERLISAKDRQLKALTQDLLTGNKRIKGYDERWRKYRLSEVLTEHCEASSGREEVYSVSVHKGLINQVEHLGRVFAAKDTSNYNLVKPGDIVYTKSPTGDFPYGIIKQSRIKDAVIVSPLYGVFTPRSAQLGTFLNFYFESPVRTANYLLPVIQKGAKNTINITNSTFLSNSLYLPTCDEEAKAIADTLNTARHEIDLLKKQADAFRRQKRGLMQKLLTGEWRVRTGKEAA